MDAVIHMATLRITACAAEPREALEVMCDGTFNVVEAAQAAGVKKVVAASSASIYGLADDFPTREDHHPYNNRTWYGASKIMLEGPAAFVQRHVRPALRRAALLQRVRPAHGHPRQVHRGARSAGWSASPPAQPPLILGDGKTPMDFVYIEDVARANILALASRD